MKLYKLEASNWGAFFGHTPEEHNAKNVTTIAQTPSCDAFLLLAKDAQDGLELLDSVPAGFDFTYCQEWGLIINDAIVDKVILDLRKKAYGPWEDQLDYIYHNSVADWKTNIIDPVKAKYPKR
tara:strand:- start:592 stop:960 length:369 start_codon:yes stop_codon:yes gene_type:complete